MDKKAFAKVITKIRKDMGTDSYPKAMMTRQQEAKNTCTVNCDSPIKGTWAIVDGRHTFTPHPEQRDSLAMAKEVLADQRLIDLLATCNAKATVEPIPQTKAGYQVRIRW